MTVTERIALYRKFLNAVLASGPDVNDDLDDLTQVRDALTRIASRTAKRFGKMAADPNQEMLGENQWKEIRQDSEVQTLEQQVISSHKPKMAASAGSLGAEANKGALLDLLQQVFQFLMANPALLQLIIQLLQPKPATT